MAKKRTIAAAVVAGAVAISGAVAGLKGEAPTGCVARPRGVRTCLRDMAAAGPVPALHGVLMSEDSPFPAAEARGDGCVPATCPEAP